ncbi:MAG: hypothetical protein AB7K09_16940 [Planctomycetota bacterium]
MNATIFRTLMAASVAAIVGLAPGLGFSDGENTPDNPATPLAFPSDAAERTIDGVTYRMAMEGTYGFDETPVVLIEAHHDGSEAITRSIVLHVTTRSATSMVSRVPQPAVEVQAVPVEIALAAGERKVFRAVLSDKLLAAPKADNELERAMGIGNFKVAVTAADQSGKTDEREELAVALRGGTPTMVRFSVDPARIYSVSHEVVRDEAGQAKRLLITVRNLTGIAFDSFGAAFASADGAASATLEGEEVAGIGANQTRTLSFSLKGVDTDTVSGFVNVGWLIQQMSIKLDTGASASAGIVVVGE